MSEQIIVTSENQNLGPLAFDINFVKQLLNYSEYVIVGKSVLRIDGLDKVLGLAKYT